MKSITADGVNDEKKAAIFPAVLTLDQGSINIDGKQITLTPGMNVTAAVKTGRRRGIDYLFSPIYRTFNESLGERQTPAKSGARISFTTGGLTCLD